LNLENKIVNYTKVARKLKKKKTSVVATVVIHRIRTKKFSDISMSGDSNFLVFVLVSSYRRN